MVNKMNLQESILNAVNTIVEQRTNELKVDKTITAFIEKNIGVFSGKALYRVSYEGGFFEAVVLNAEETYLPHTPVYVLIPQGNFSKEKIIIGRANNINLGNESAVIANAANQYSLVGTNLLYNAKKDDTEKISNLQYGVYSYHDPKEEETNPNSILHRYNQICSYNLDDYEESFDRKELTDKLKTVYNQNLGFNEENLNILKEQATTLMLKADFKTNLTREQRQQAEGEYGLILNLVFNNLNKDYGSTNGEIFEKISDIIVGETYLSKEQAENFNGNKSRDNSNNDFYGYYNIKLKDIHYYYINEIKNSNANIRNNIHLLIEYTNNLKTTFSTNNTTKALYTDIVNNTLIAYLSFLSELELTTNIETFNTIYEEWWNKVVGNTENKIISYKFSSNNMIGNPLSFNQWNSQYQILDVDIKNLIRVDSIILYKQGFKEDQDSESNWPLNNPGPDIFVKNLQLYPVKPIDSENGDYTLKVQPKDSDNDFNTGILTGTDPTDIVTFEAVFMRKMSENLSRSTGISYYWFKEDFSVVDANSAGYNIMAGAGWRKISSNAGVSFTTNGVNNLAYKNNYKCVARYIESENNTIILSAIFTVYNKSIGTDILLESDLGTIFSFDAGIPEITCKINEDSNNSDTIENYQEIISTDDLYPKYRYYWAITDAANGNKIFLNEVDNKSLNESTNIITYNTAKNIINDIEYYKIVKTDDILEKVKTEQSIEATRINYPVNKLSSGFTVECFVKKKVSIIGSNNIRYVDAGSASLEFLNKGLDIDLNTFKLIVENGNQVFQYDEYGNAPNNISKKEPLDILPLHAKVLAPSGVEIKNSNYSVEWIFPTENTMIIAGETLETNPSTQLPQLYRGVSCNFDISSLYNPNYWNNQITCHVRYNNQDLYKDTKFLFTKIGENGTNGTDVTAKIYYTGNDILNVLHNEPLTLYIQDVINSNDISTTISKAMFNVPDGNNKLKYLSDNLSIIGDNGVLDIDLYQKGVLLSKDDYAATYPRWTLLGNASYSQSYGKYFSIVKKGTSYTINWDGSNSNKQKELYQIIKAEVQLKSTGQMYYATYNIPFIWYSSQNNLITTYDHLLAIDRGSYLSSVLYNADGRNPIYNHNQGLKFINIPSNITKIIWEAKGGTGDSSCFNFVLEDGTLKKTYEKQENITTEEMINILPDDVYDGGITNNYIKTSFYDNEDNLVITAYVPIYMSLNTFGLASLNAWDGNHVTVNEDEGYIMSPQIGAGEKDENNRFTGILMGKTEGDVGHTGQTDSQTGLFGYTHGVQSIFLDAKTGNATFGLPNGLHLDEDGNLEETNNFNEGRIELRPGGESTIGGWTLGNRSLYYTSKEENGKWVHSGELEKRNQPDYVPDWKTGLIEKDISYSYSKHHEKDIKYNQSGILLYAGENPYISIKGRPFTEEDIPKDSAIDDSEKESFIKPEDSIELQLDPATPTLFTIFRHNGGKREGIEGVEGTIEEKDKYEVGSRTFLAGINSQGEFISNGLRNANTTDITIPKGANGKETWKAGSLITKFAVNTLSAFEDFSYSIPKTNHVGFEITANKENTLAHFFTKINGLKVNGSDEINNYYDPTLHISGGYNDLYGEYSRPLALHGKNIQMYALNGTGNLNDNKFLFETDANLQISTDEAKLQLGSTYFNLFRDTNSNNKYNTLMTTNGLKINVGEEIPREHVIEEVNISETGENWIRLEEQSDFNKYKKFSPEDCFILDNETGSFKVISPNSFKYINLPSVNNYLRNLDEEILPLYYINTDVEEKYYVSKNNFNNDFYYKVQDLEKYIPIGLYEYTYYGKKNNNNDIKEITDFYRFNEDIGYFKLNDNEIIDTNNLKDYFVQVSKSDLQLDNELYFYVSENTLNNNIYCYKNNQFIKINNFNNIYKKKLDENGQEIYINKKYIDELANPFIIIPQDLDITNNSNIALHYFKNQFDDNNLYFKLNINKQSYYVTNFILEYREKAEDGTFQSTDNPKDIIFFNTQEDKESFWYPNLYKSYPLESYGKYFIGFSSNEDNTIWVELTDPNMVDFYISEDNISKNDVGILNIYKKYNGVFEDNTLNNDEKYKYILWEDYISATEYYNYFNYEDKNKFYSNLRNSDDENKEYYKIKDDIFTEKISDNPQFYFKKDSNDFIPWSDDNIEEDYYIQSNNEYIKTDKIDIDNNLLYRKITNNIDNITYFRWVNLLDWLNGDSLTEYCLDEKEEPIQKNTININEKYRKNENNTYSNVNSYEFNYIFLEDNRNSKENFFISIEKFKENVNDITNRVLFYENKEYNIGELTWEKDFKNNIKLNQNKILRQEKISSIYSQQFYSIYSGTYRNYIQKNNNYLTKIDIDNDIRIQNTRLINFNSNKDININCLNGSLTNNDAIGKIYLGNQGAKFVCLENRKEYGFTFNTNSLKLSSKQNIGLETENTIKMLTFEKGSGTQYNHQNPQILFIAGGKNINDTAATKLILNSSNNNWKNAKVTNGNYASYPVFQVETEYGKIGIIPRYLTSNSYDNFFYVGMDQHINKGLRVSGTYRADRNAGLLVDHNVHAKKFISTDPWNGIFNFTPPSQTSKTFGQGGSVGGLGKSSTFKIPVITIKKGAGQPSLSTANITVTLPSADAIWNAIAGRIQRWVWNQGFLTASTANATYVSKATYNRHSHHISCSLTGSNIHLTAPKDGGPVIGSIGVSLSTGGPK